MDATDTNKRTVRVTIFNQPYTVSAVGDPRETEELAAQIDELMSSIARRAGNLDTTRTAVLACLHLADRLRTVERQLDALRNGINVKTRDFAQLLDQAVGESEPRA
jgi:cell division protein ZapA